MGKYRLSAAADQDFDQLFEYGIDNFGLAKAKSYVDGLIVQFQSIAENPLHYQAVDHIRKGYRRSVYGKHAIYYIVSNNCVDVMRILRSENPNTAFE
ncbi:type II toxin-antitoxin system RelE/ParE family toxin [Bowmanella yangjiangensis]|uniref:Toxin n=1 Tax=Bowmanella yangjiangensis TaxID=2811230 RepID=A0ABS3CPT0_9ALTE|nr:type II toxin-antitoxin system RelE/ParE family toxin [Bowmanella yangjiangensis]MBN7818700.1 type II toxin-antitoxin system RelE/ParE family toxin [Bowmanella yangjiangensis]